MSDSGAFLFARAVQALARIEGMRAENMQRENRGESVAYVEDAFNAVLDDLSASVDNAMRCDDFGRTA